MPPTAARFHASSVRRFVPGRPWIPSARPPHRRRAARAIGHSMTTPAPYFAVFFVVKRNLACKRLPDRSGSPAVLDACRAAFGLDPEVVQGERAAAGVRQELRVDRRGLQRVAVRIGGAAEAEG